MLNTKYLDYLFTDKKSGEDFVVEIDTTEFWTAAEAKAAAYDIAAENFERPKFIMTLSEQEAEILGLDTY